ncbi:hypothetical protein Y1Q_0021628 [Alligator mississippiensis]|uniref:Uncharacterized protein n=1 Tax=Alligator mississippiensis TaxID=8496 RepID=A0A151PAB5_ALLMI|nr:hypothetical protein Y1Q_0021628 [Alligator mississippiensis]
MGIMGTDCPAGKDVGEAALVVDDALQDDREVSLLVDECLSSLGQAKDEDLGAMHIAHAVGETHVAEASDHLLWVDEADEEVARDILDDQAHLPC